MQFIGNAWGKFHDIKHKCLLGLRDELVKLWWSKVKNRHVEKDEIFERSTLLWHHSTVFTVDIMDVNCRLFWWRRWGVTEALTLVSWLSFPPFSFCLIRFCWDFCRCAVLLFSFLLFQFRFETSFKVYIPRGFFLLKLTQFLFVLIIMLLCKLKI